MSFDEEVRLVSRILEREPAALEQFISEYRPFIYAILTRHLSLLPEDADELFQRFLIHVWESDFRRLRRWCRRSRLYAYLGKMVRNLGRDYLRERSRYVCAEELPWCSTDTVADCERSDLMAQALLKLSPRDRELLRRRYYMDQSYLEIAQGLNMTVNSVGVALFRAQRRLRKNLQSGL